LKWDSSCAPAAGKLHYDKILAGSQIGRCQWTRNQAQDSPMKASYQDTTKKNNNQ
jgi:hypothetical protein